MVFKGMISMSKRPVFQMSIYSLIIFFFALQSTYALTGKQVYMQNCVACHGATGKGTIPGAPDFTDSKGVLTKSDQALLRYIDTMLQNPGQTRTMPVKGGNPNLTDQEIKDSLSYIRQSFGKQTSSTVATAPGNNKIQNQDVQTSVKKRLDENTHLNSSTKEISKQLSENIALGASAWASACSGCHNARNPTSLSGAQWHTVMLHMRRQANLTAKQTRDILQFLQNSSQ